MTAKHPNVSEAKSSENQFYAAVICRGDEEFPGCGQVPLTEAQYTAQLRHPDITWRCPRCRRDADFDDSYFEDVHGIISSEDGSEHPF